MICEICEEAPATKIVNCNNWRTRDVFECADCAKEFVTDGEMVRWHNGSATVRDMEFDS
jgi:protein-arginine kinase activator protein McsA